MDSLLDRLNHVANDILEDDGLTVSRDASSQEIDGWDSRSRVTLPPFKIEKPVNL